MAHASHAKVLPADLSAPPFVNAWRARALMIAVLFTVTAVVLAFLDGSMDHVYRAWVVGLMLTFGFSCGGLLLLMLQYVTGGKWGLLLRRPLEAMSRTLPLVFVYWLALGFMLKRLYMWANPGLLAEAISKNLVSHEQILSIRHCIEWKKAMLNVGTYWVYGLICFVLWGFYTWRLNSM